MHNKKLLKAIGILLGLIVLLPICIILGGLFLREASYVKDTLNWRSKTTPLSADVILDMCQKLEIPEQDWRCKDNAIVYAPDFFYEINERFTPTKDKPVKIEDVNRILEKYVFKTEPIVKVASNGMEYYVVWYGLNPDHRFPIVAFVEKDGNVFRLIATVVH